MASAYRCPLCMHSAWDMDTHWDHIDKEIALSPMPTEYQDATVKVSSHLNVSVETWLEVSVMQSTKAQHGFRLGLFTN